MNYLAPFLKIIVCSLFFLFSTTNIQAQGRNQQPTWDARAGVGLLPTFLKDFTSNEVLPVSFELRYRPTQKFSVGFLAGMSISEAHQVHHTGAKRVVRNSFQMYAIRTAIHSAPFDKWEIYGGSTFGYTNSQVTYTESASSIERRQDEPSFFPEAPERGGFLFSAFIGTQYQLHERISLFGELGFGLSIATTGVSVRL